MLEKPLQFCPSCGMNAIAHPGSFDGSFYKSQILEFPEMLTYGCLCQTQLLNQFGIDASPRPKELLENGNPGRMPQNPGSPGQLVLLFCK
jgi:hypothetical protein